MIQDPYVPPLNWMSQKILFLNIRLFEEKKMSTVITAHVQKIRVNNVKEK